MTIIILVLVLFLAALAVVMHCVRVSRQNRWWHCDDCGIYFSDSGDSAVEPPTNQHVEGWAVQCEGCLSYKLYLEKHKHENNHS